MTFEMHSLIITPSRACFLCYIFGLASALASCTYGLVKIPGDLRKKNSCDFHIFFFWVFNLDFIMYVEFTRIAASNTANDHVTNYVTHRIFNTNVQHSGAYFIFKIDENLASLTGFNTI